MSGPLPGPPGGLRAAQDTLVVTGGAVAVDAEAVRSCAARLAAAADSVRHAVTWCARARFAVGQPLREMWAAPGLADRQGATLAAIEDATATLAARADLYDLLGWRLLRAAGLYEEAESLAERLVGGVLAAEAHVLGRVLAASPVLAAGPAALAVAAGVGVWLADRVTDGRSSEVLRAAVPGVVRGVAPWTDELVDGVGSGVASGRPGAADGRSGVPGGARVLVDTVRGLPFASDGGDGVVVERVDAAAFAAGRLPDWATAGGTVSEAVLRAGDLYPWTGGVPAATVAVQRVEAADGAVSWAVLVPGTQSLPPADHPWDGLTDLELMGQEADGASAGVVAALDAAGAGPDEPVVLVGHSLGGIAATALAASPGFAERFRLGGVVTAGSPVGTFTTPPGVPVLHLENAEEIVSSTDGRSSTENPRTADRVTVSRSLAESADAVDRAASGSVVQAHGAATHARTLDLAAAAGDPCVLDVLGAIEPLLQGDRVTTTFWSVRRAPDAAATVGPVPAPSPGPEPAPAPARGALSP